MRSKSKKDVTSDLAQLSRMLTRWVNDKPPQSMIQSRSKEAPPFPDPLLFSTAFPPPHI